MFEQWKKRYEAVENRILEQLKPMWIIGVILITAFMMMGANRYNIVQKLSWNRSAMNRAVVVDFNINGWGSRGDYEHQFGETVIALYASLALIVFGVAFWRYSSATKKVKYALALMSTFMVTGAAQFIYQKIEWDSRVHTGWWNGYGSFAVQTLSPIAFALFFACAYYLLWEATKPNNAPAPGGDSGSIFQPGVARQQGLKELGGGEQAEGDTPRAHNCPKS